MKYSDAFKEDFKRWLKRETREIECLESKTVSSRVLCFSRCVILFCVLRDGGGGDCDPESEELPPCPSRLPDEG